MRSLTKLSPYDRMGLKLAQPVRFGVRGLGQRLFSDPASFNLTKALGYAPFLTERRRVSRRPKWRALDWRALDWRASAVNDAARTMA